MTKEKYLSTRVFAAADRSAAADRPAADVGYRTYERIAPVYDFLDSFYEVSWKRFLRPDVFKGLSGRVLDAGVGTGLNIRYYPADCQVVGIDFSPSMLDRARKRAERAGRELELLEMDVCNTVFPDNHFDAVTATFVFNTLSEDDQRAALRELRRVCKSDGEIRLLDYCMSDKAAVRAWMRCLSPWLRWAFGGTYDIHTERLAPDAGLVVAEERFLVGDFVKLLTLRPAA